MFPTPKEPPCPPHRPSCYTNSTPTESLPTTPNPDSSATLEPATSGTSNSATSTGTVLPSQSPPSSNSTLSSTLPLSSPSPSSTSAPSTSPSFTSAPSTSPSSTSAPSTSLPSISPPSISPPSISPPPSTSLPLRTSLPPAQTSAAPPHRNVGAIAGGTVGGFVALASLILIALFWLARRRRHRIAPSAAYRAAYGTTPPPIFPRSDVSKHHLVPSQNSNNFLVGNTRSTVFDGHQSSVVY